MNVVCLGSEIETNHQHASLYGALFLRGCPEGRQEIETLEVDTVLYRLCILEGHIERCAILANAFVDEHGVYQVSRHFGHHVRR